MELRALPDILEPYCISELQFARIKEMPFFKRVYEDFLVEWNRVTSTPERIRLISAVMLEEGLPRMGSQMVDKEVSPAVAIETGKFFAKIAGVGETKTEGPPGEKFVINISLGEETKLQFTKDVTPATPQSVCPPETLEGLSGNSSETERAPSDPGGPRHQKEGSGALRQVTEGQSEKARMDTYPKRS
jgi:hypothetical protein